MLLTLANLQHLSFGSHPTEREIIETEIISQFFFFVCAFICPPFRTFPASSLLTLFQFKMCVCMVKRMSAFFLFSLFLCSLSFSFLSLRSLFLFDLFISLLYFLSLCVCVLTFCSTESLISSYFNLVRCNVQDSVPKAIMLARLHS